MTAEEILAQYQADYAIKAAESSALWIPIVESGNVAAAENWYQNEMKELIELQAQAPPTEVIPDGNV